MRSDAKQAAAILSRALPYVQRYDGAVIVVKLGGHAMHDPKVAKSFARDIVLMRQIGVNPVVVHGGGPRINEMLTRLDIRSEFKNGKRVTDEATAEVVEMVLTGSVNKEIVQAINAEGGRAVGLSGKDARLMPCERADPALGLVGKPGKISTDILQELTSAGIIPVIAPIGFGENGETLNVNGDTAAGAIAAALCADRLLLLTDVAGVKDAQGQVLAQLSPAEINTLIDDGVIAGGMIPKAQTALAALSGGVRAVVILDGREIHSCLRELFTDSGAGTLIRK